MITIRQSRAARGLLGWTQQDLADASGLSKTAINNFEKNNSDIKSVSLRAVRMAFEAMGVEFLGEDGLRKRTDRSEILRGAEGFKTLISDILHKLAQDNSSGLCVINMHTEQIAALNQIASAGADIRVLHGEDINPGEPVRCKSAILPAQTSGMGPATFIYGSKIAFVTPGNLAAILIHSSDIAQSERARFEKLWDLYSTDESASNHTQRGSV